MCEISIVSSHDRFYIFHFLGYGQKSCLKLDIFFSFLISNLYIYKYINTLNCYLDINQNTYLYIGYDILFEFSIHFRATKLYYNNYY